MRHKWLCAELHKLPSMCCFLHSKGLPKNWHTSPFQNRIIKSFKNRTDRGLRVTCLGGNSWSTEFFIVKTCETAGCAGTKLISQPKPTRPSHPCNWSTRWVCWSCCKNVAMVWQVLADLTFGTSVHATLAPQTGWLSCWVCSISSCWTESKRISLLNTSTNSCYCSKLCFIGLLEHSCCC